MRLPLTALAVLAMLAPALAHGPAEWINQGRYTNSVGQLCCGPTDCGVMVGGHVAAVVGGYRVDAVFQIGDGENAKRVEVHELVPYSEVQPSPDGRYWRCAWGGERKCFFAGPPGP